MTEFEYGDLLWLDIPVLGKALYMVVDPPRQCPECGERLVSWEEAEDGRAYCPACGAEVPPESRPVCRNCGEADGVSLAIAANNAFGLGSDGEMTSYNHAVNRVVSFCGKSLAADIAAGRIRRVPPREAVERKRLIAWTTSNRYEPGEPIPDEIKRRFPLPGEEPPDKEDGE